jgi:hypothetical protein
MARSFTADIDDAPDCAVAGIADATVIAHTATVSRAVPGPQRGLLVIL